MMNITVSLKLSPRSLPQYGSNRKQPFEFGIPIPAGAGENGTLTDFLYSNYYKPPSAVAITVVLLFGFHLTRMLIHSKFISFFSNEAMTIRINIIQCHHDFKLKHKAGSNN